MKPFLEFIEGCFTSLTTRLLFVHEEVVQILCFIFNFGQSSINLGLRVISVGRFKAKVEVSSPVQCCVLDHCILYLLLTRIIFEIFSLQNKNLQNVTIGERITLHWFDHIE